MTTSKNSPFVYVTGNVSLATPDSLFKLRVGRNGMEEAPHTVALYLSFDIEKDIKCQIVRAAEYGHTPYGTRSVRINPRTDALALADLLSSDKFESMAIALLNAEGYEDLEDAQYAIDEAIRDLPHFEQATA